MQSSQGKDCNLLIMKDRKFDRNILHASEDGEDKQN
jgi:hypothetical protein